jgi:hypothetical protein
MIQSYDSMIQSYGSMIHSYDSMIQSMIQWLNNNDWIMNE